MLKKHIPNVVTTCNLVSGAFGSLCLFKDQLDTAVACLWLGSFFDFWDGFLARFLKVQSNLGKELDSLSDVVTFGWLPMAILYKTLCRYTPADSWLPYVSLCTLLCAAFRLARFNTGNTSKIYFSGLPVPAYALFISTLPSTLSWSQRTFNLSPSLLSRVTVCVTALSLLMVSTLRFRSCKLTSMTWSSDRVSYVCIFSVLSALSIWGTKGLFWCMVIYIVGSVLTHLMGIRQTTPSSPTHFTSFPEE